MESRDWKQVAELIGIAAIVASLVFVGLQLRQAQSIATAERLEAGISHRIARNELVQQNVEILAKANRGEVLSDEEKISLNLIVDSAWNEAILTQRSREIIGAIGSTGPAVGFARFLFDNPGIRDAWENHRDRRHRAWAVTGGYERLKEFDARVDDVLESFDENIVVE